jgi:hypothetical protein
LAFIVELELFFALMLLAGNLPRLSWALTLGLFYQTGEIRDVGTKQMIDRGAGEVKVELTEAGQRVIRGHSGLMDIRYSGEPVFRGARMFEFPEYVVLGHFRTEVTQYDAQRGSMINAPAIICGWYGKGRVIAISPHPEMTKGLEFVIKRVVLATARCE